MSICISLFKIDREISIEEMHTNVYETFFACGASCHLRGWLCLFRALRQAGQGVKKGGGYYGDRGPFN